MQRLYNLSDEINERLSFMRFLELDVSDKVPDAKTIWYFREALTKAGDTDELFLVFRRHLEEQGIITHSGSIVDASFVDRRQQNTGKEQSEAVKRGEIPQEWQGEAKSMKNTLRQTDLDARVGVKYHKRHVGYKMHNKVDAESKCIVDVIVTPANVADAKVIRELANEIDKVVYADKGYYGKRVAEQLSSTVQNEIHERANRNHPLSSAARERNRRCSGILTLVEYVFGTMKYNMKCGVLRCVGAMRAKMQIMLLCLTYNMKRAPFLQRCEQY